MTHDFKGALGNFTAPRNSELGFSRMKVDIAQPDYEAIHTAIRIADRLQSGEVSTGVLKAMGDCEDDAPWLVVFQAMAKQLIKEVEDE